MYSTSPLLLLSQISLGSEKAAQGIAEAGFFQCDSFKLPSLWPLQYEEKALDLSNELPFRVAWAALGSGGAVV